MTDLECDLIIAKADIEALKLQLAESQRREQAAVEDMKRIANKIANSNEFLSGGIDKVSDLQLGRCDVCKKTCYEDNPCNFEWRGPQAGEGERDG